MPLYPGDGAWIDGDLGNRWLNFGQGYANGGYCRIVDQVFLRGGVVSRAVSSQIFQLPEGFRPSFNLVFPVPTRSATTWSIGTVVILPDGWVTYHTGSGNYYGLDGVSFFV